MDAAVFFVIVFLVYTVLMVVAIMRTAQLAKEVKQLSDESKSQARALQDFAYMLGAKGANAPAPVVPGVAPQVDEQTLNSATEILANASPEDLESAKALLAHLGM